MTTRTEDPDVWRVRDDGTAIRVRDPVGRDARARDDEGGPRDTSDDGASDDDAPDDDAPDDDAPDDAPKVPLAHRRGFWIALVVALALIVGIALYWWFAVHPYESTDDAFIDADTVNVAPQVAGRISTVSVIANQHVEAGDPLVTIASSALEAALQGSRAQLAQARATVVKSEAAVAQARAGVDEARAQHEALQAQAKSATDTASRDEAILASDTSAISDKSVADARDAARAATAQAKAGASSIETARTAVAASEAELTASRASVDVAASAVDSARIDLGHADIVAPVTGHVVQRSVEVGSYVTPGQAMMALVPDALYVTANFKETQLARVRVGQSAALEIDAFPDAGLTGKVVSIQRGAGQAFQLLPPQNATGNYVKVVQRVPVRLSIEGDIADYPLGPGMSVEPTVRID